MSVQQEQYSTLEEVNPGNCPPRFYRNLDKIGKVKFYDAIVITIVTFSALTVGLILMQDKVAHG